MEWVETTAKSIEEAKEMALDKLGVHDSEAEFDVLEEPRQGLFGRTRGQARVRARITPKAPPPKEDRGRPRRKPRSDSKRSDSKRSDSKRGSSAKAGTPKREGSDDRSGNSRPAGNRGGSSNRGGRDRKRSEPREESPIEDVRKCVDDFLNGLVAAFGIEDGTVNIPKDSEEVAAQIEGKHGLLLGPKARTLDAIQELTRITAQRTAPSTIRIKVDVGGYREKRGQALGEFAKKAADNAIADGAEVMLEPMSASDRKIVHDALTDIEGISTSSTGTDPRRRVVVIPDALEQD